MWTFFQTFFLDIPIFKKKSVSNTSQSPTNISHPFFGRDVFVTLTMGTKSTDFRSYAKIQQDRLAIVCSKRYIAAQCHQLGHPVYSRFADGGGGYTTFSIFPVFGQYCFLDERQGGVYVPIQKALEKGVPRCMGHGR